jgi:hypothetical protein
MQILWCWRCKAEVPILSEDEFASIGRLYVECMAATKEFCQRWNLPLADANTDQLFRPVRQRYEQLTGTVNCHENAIMHHRISLYGPQCKSCGKPLRTPRARMCGNCMKPVAQTAESEPRS